MWEAYDCVQILKLNVQIDSIAAYDDNVLVGTNKGHLLMYRVSCCVPDNKIDVHLLRYNKNFSKKPIQQLDVIPEHQLLVCLSDNVICVHDMASNNFPILTTIQETRGATLFTLDLQRTKSQTGGTSLIVRLCVVVKRRLHLYYWKNGMFHKLREALIMPDVPRAIAWVKETICVGFKGDCDYTLYHVNEKGEKKTPLCPTGNRQPSVLNMNEEAFILGRDNHSIFVDTQGVPVHKLQKNMKWEKVPRELVYDEPYLVAILPEGVEVRTVEPSLLVQSHELDDPRLIIQCRSGLLYIASSSFVWCLQNVAWSRQIHLLLEQKQFQLALKVANISDETSEDRARNIHQIQTLYAYDLFSKKQFKESMEQFLKLDTDPYEVIQLFPNLLPQQIRKKSNIETVVKLDVADLENGLVALIDYLTMVRHAKLKEKADKDKMKEEIEEDLKKTGSNQKGIEWEKGFNYEHYTKATDQLLQIIDTTLLKCYLQTNDAFVAPLLRLNHCNLSEAEKMLKKHEKVSELIILYQTKGLHKKALELLHKQSTQPDSSLHGHERTVVYLQHLGKENLDLIFQYAGWVLEQHPLDGLSIFTEDWRLEEEKLPRPRVLDYLLRSHKKLVIPYLEHVINVWNDKNPILHTALVHQYQEHAQQLRAEKKEEEEKLVRAKLLAFLESSEYYTPETVLVQFPYDCMFEERAIVLGKLGRHEQVLSIYVMILGDVKRAVQYCGQVYDKKQAGSEEVYVLLMKMLIDPPDSWLVGVQVSPVTSKPDMETALSLLEEHATKMHPIQALEALPDSVPVGRIRHFLEASLQHQLSERRRLQVLKGLEYAENLQVQELRMGYESQSIKMTEVNVCSVCKKRFGKQSAFTRFPDGEIVHFNCQDRKVYP